MDLAVAFGRCDKVAAGQESGRETGRDGQRPRVFVSRDVARRDFVKTAGICEMRSTLLAAERRPATDV